jgi:sugar phosphate isomerase/epimerase
MGSSTRRDFLQRVTAGGTGHIDFKPVFAQASLAGLKHFVIEQDNAAAWRDSLAAARVSFHNLKEMLA